MAVLVGSHASAAGDGTQRTSSSRGAVGWRRTETRGRTLHEIEECAARLVVAGPLWAPQPGGLSASMAQHQPAPIALALAPPSTSPIPTPSPLPVAITLSQHPDATSSEFLRRLPRTSNPLRL